MKEIETRDRTLASAAAALAALALPLAGCTEETEGEDPAEHACEQVQEAGMAVTASEAADTTAPELMVADTPHTVTLPAGVPGYVRVEVGSDGADALLFTRTADLVQGLWLGTEEQTLPTGAPNAACPEDLPDHFDLSLVEGTWYIEMLSAQGGEEWVMLTSAAGHSDE